MKQITYPLALVKNLALGRFLSYLCLASMALSFVALYSDWLQLRVLQTTPAGDLKYSADANSSDNRQETIASIKATVSVSAMVLLLMWFYHSYKNLPLLGAKGQRFKPGWAAGGFLVPILNLKRPFDIALELWHGSNPDCTDPTAWKSSRVPLLIGLWWSSWLILNAQGIYVVLEAMKPGAVETVENMKRLTLLTMGNTALDAVSMLFTFMLVDRIGKFQAAKSPLVSGGSSLD